MIKAKTKVWFTFFAPTAVKGGLSYLTDSESIKGNNDFVMEDNWYDNCVRIFAFIRSPGCDESSWNENGTCIFTPTTTGPSSHENDRITSSIMSFPQLKNIHLFCDENNHNGKAPNKHNFLCEAKSTSEIIYSHPDFKNLAYR